ncbi:MAG TPA: 5'-deoxyadenosine deaminase [Pyrinomonadaceae bacterium]|jgi:5-methylthioadenosine/S-adenosylhomocysteine deaminase
MEQTVLIRGGAVVTMDAAETVLVGDVLVRGRRIEAVGGDLSAAAADATIDARGCAVLPGFVQTHVHLCQTLFRGAADDLALLDWLKRRVWPLEAAHNPSSLRASARLGVAELIRGGTTCALTMETVNHTEEVLRVVEESGFRATVGKCMMDKGEEVPPGLREESEDSIRESLALLERWHGRADGRVRYCFAPRFAVSCTKGLLERVASLARERGVMIHTHASENVSECELVESETGMRNVLYLDSLGVSGPHVLLAHCVHLDGEETELLASKGTHVAHCPSSNMKLGSGVAPVSEMLGRGVSVSLGADGAPCNNRLDMFTEMRSAALLQKVSRGADALPAARVLRMATLGGARALGLEGEIGSLEAGKLADVTVLELGRLHTTPRPEVVSTVVYAAEARDVRDVLIDGRVVLRDGRLQTFDEREVVAEAAREYELLAARSGI